MPKQSEAKKDDVIKPQNYNLNQFITRKILMLSKRYESIKVDRRHGRTCMATCTLGDSLEQQH